METATQERIDHPMTLDQIIIKAIYEALNEESQSIMNAAARLGISRWKLARFIKKHNISVRTGTC